MDPNAWDVKSPVMVYNDPFYHRAILILAVVAGVSLLLICACLLFITYKLYFKHTENLPPPPLPPSSLPPQIFDDHLVDSFAVATFLPESQDSSDQNRCCVCHNDFQAEEQLITLSVCHHRYHAVCIRDWFRCRIICPVCRHDYADEPPEQPTAAAVEELPQDLEAQLELELQPQPLEH